MTKLYEVKTSTDWVNLNTLVGDTVTGVVEFFNASREDRDILWTESTNSPEAGAFCRILKRQKSTIFTLGAQPIWIKSESMVAKLMVSTPNTATVTLKGTL